MKAKNTNRAFRSALSRITSLPHRKVRTTSKSRPGSKPTVTNQLRLGRRVTHSNSIYNVTDGRCERVEVAMPSLRGTLAFRQVDCFRLHAKKNISIRTGSLN